MEDFEFRALLDLLMCSDPYPCDGQTELAAFANRIAVQFGYSDWVEAYHMLPQGEV